MLPAMPTTLNIGPLALSVSYLITLAALATGLALAGRARPAELAAELGRHAWRIAAVALLAARLGFVWRFRVAYADAPLDILNIRDGGWEPQVGLIAAWVYTLVLVRRHAAWRKPLLVAVGAASAVWVGGQVALMGAVRDRPPLPDITLQTVSGQRAPLAAFKGKPMVVNIWATWCPPCLREMPVLLRAQQAHGDIHYVFVNQGETPQQVRAYLVRHNLPLRNVLLDTRGQLAAAYGVSAYPTTLYVDAQGQLVDMRMGEVTWASLLEKVQGLRGAR